MTRKELKMQAKAAIKGKVFFLLLPLIIVGAIVSVEGIINYFITKYAGWETIAIWNIITIIISVVMIPINVGLASFFLKFAKGEKVEAREIFAQYKISFWEPVKAYLLAGLFIFLGLICFIIPGILLALKYSQLGFVFADNPEIEYDDAMKRSRELMKGRKGEFFILGLSFILWVILVPFTLGLLLIYLVPYIQVTYANYYMAISGMNKENIIENKSDDGLFNSEDDPYTDYETENNKQDDDIF